MRRSLLDQCYIINDFCFAVLHPLCHITWGMFLRQTALQPPELHYRVLHCSKQHTPKVLGGKSGRYAHTCTTADVPTMYMYRIYVLHNSNKIKQTSISTSTGAIYSLIDSCMQTTNKTPCSTKLILKVSTVQHHEVTRQLQIWQQ